MDDLKSRLDKLEEAQAFSERALEQLNEQLLKAYEQIEHVNNRLRTLERRLTSVEDFEGANTPDDERR